MISSVQCRITGFRQGGAAFSSQTSQPTLTLNGYQDVVVTTDQKRDAGLDLSFPLLGLFGETGSLLSEAKKKQRDAASYQGYAKGVIEELGDVMWYLTIIAARSNLRIAEIIRPGSDLPLATLQPQRLSPQLQPSPAFERTLLQLASEVGLLMIDARTGTFIGTGASLSDRIAAIFRALLSAANEAGVTLEQAGQQNIHKILDRWPSKKEYPPLFDELDVIEERFSRHLTIDLFERNVNSKTYVVQRCNGLNIGDRLTDNIMKKDDYRFHDVFHYSYAAVLGWSPVLRALMRIKRKNRPAVDEGQDGGRAILIEEGVSTWVFGHAKDLKLFAGVKPNGVAFGLLKSVRQFVAGYEPDACPLWLWEEAILQGYQAFRFLKEKRRGRVHLDLAQRRLVIEELPQ
jgi:NTP pyrophosphatase (non-canonical NTP hydrolase)